MATTTATTIPASGEATHKTIDTDKDASKLMQMDGDSATKAPAASVTSANKTKTPMCLVNELVRANQVNISHLAYLCGAFGVIS